VINGFSDLLLTRGQGDEEYLSGLKEIRAAGERAADLTRNLLSLSRKQRVQLKAADLNVVVVEAETMFGRLMGEDIELITCLSPDLGLVMADSGQLHQILMNLLINARDAMPHGGRIVIETKNIEADEDFMCRHPDFKPGAYVYLGLTDTGTGMSDEVRQHLFEPFFTTKELGKGTGLGLATIYGIVQQSAGRIEVTTRLGEGTGFHIYLPRVQTEALAHPGANGSAATLQGSGTVLVVEDQDAVRQYTCAVLEGAGYRVIQAANGPDALALAQQSKEMIHLLVTDLAMPLMNGRTLAETLKLSRPGMRVLFTSGHAEETIDSRGLIDSEMAYLPKPFSPEELTVKVREMLAKPTEAGKRSPLSG
jgi:CheY-like chemotaxis protein